MLMHGLKKQKLVYLKFHTLLVIFKMVVAVKGFKIHFQFKGQEIHMFLKVEIIVLKIDKSSCD